MVNKTLFANSCCVVLLVLSAAICSAQPLTIMTGCPLPQARVGTPYSVAFAAAGGTLPTIGKSYQTGLPRLD